MISITLLLVLAAFVCTVLAATGRVPLWVAMLFIVIVLMIIVGVPAR